MIRYMSVIVIIAMRTLSMHAWSINHSRSIVDKCCKTATLIEQSNTLLVQSGSLI